MTDEQAEILGWFTTMLQSASADGGNKRAAGTKVPWKVDPEHEAAIFSHLNKWKHGEKVDPESGAHPLVHLAWRALAIAWQETHVNTLDLHELHLAARKAWNSTGGVIRHGRPAPAPVSSADDAIAHALDRQQRVSGQQCKTPGCFDTSVGGPLCNTCLFSVTGQNPRSSN